mmetsp:Transcript_27776/g.60724  ORF Transcript_27776/g.60724 Transcript_27776/m.60724 type:complete len:369 (-) Transcript_27776:1371-2477(-)
MCVISVNSLRVSCSNGRGATRIPGTGIGWPRSRAIASCRRARPVLRVYGSTTAPEPVVSLQNVKKLEMRHSPKENDVTEVYVIGTAHVSEMSCQQVRELMRAVRPDHVLVELDDERLGVLVDFGEQQSGQEDILWYTEQIRLEPPLPDVFGMPKSSKLLEPLQAQPFFPITGQQMTEDAQRLLRTGLFSSAAAAPYPPSPDMGPMMVGDVASGSVRQVNAMGRLAFRTEPQQLPAVGAVSVRVAPQVTLLIPDALPQEVEALAQRVVAVGLEAERPTHHSCLQIAEEARALLPEGVHLSFCIPEPSILGVLLQPSEVPEGDADIATGLEAFGAGAIGYAPTATKRTAQTIRLGGGSDLKAQLGIAGAS